MPLVPWFCPKSVSTTRTEKTFPFNKDTTYLAPFLTSSVSATSNWFYCFMSKTYPLASHYRWNSFVNSLANFSSVFLIVIFQDKISVVELPFHTYVTLFITQTMQPLFCLFLQFRALSNLWPSNHNLLQHSHEFY